MGLDRSFWSNKKIFLTGHSGFKGSWLSLILNQLGAKVFGYSLKPSTNPSLYQVFRPVYDNGFDEMFCDINNFDTLQNALLDFNPDIIIHMAAQPLVRESYLDPISTYKTNVIGTANLLYAGINIKNLKVFLNITTDKCYKNFEWVWPYREEDVLGGHDPYSSSKACSELVTDSFKNSFYADREIGIATARSGNVIGGGDWSTDRIIPDIIKSITNNSVLEIRNPYATRPWLYVLDSIYGYCILIEKLFSNSNEFSGPWNFSPKDNSGLNVSQLINLFNNRWPDFEYKITNSSMHEAQNLNLDSSKARIKLNWDNKFDYKQAVDLTIDWYKHFYDKDNMINYSLSQISEYIN